jgi:hypothetical protein
MLETEKTERTDDAPADLTLAEALAVAVQMHSEGELDTAEMLYR